ncbi:transketolase [Helicobacter kayseriensis]|uniref:transketolase n=1 Tax=Helicobacter kayseriensis TaxID=2905877 RepID=UPI001E349B56|nr:transketolase [Helicobacter kayseriensis]MCE3046711.1 transketolase [Helicobacter kayseriensis]MCE3047987.1 transketolase [Helicobacter kayseriensis]
MQKEIMSNTLKILCADMVQKANSGHPGAPMGLSDIAVVLSHHLHLNPQDSSWLNRDRLVFSGGHCSALVYSLLHLWGFDVSLEDLKQFRQLGSKTPGHPEFGHTHGVEITTGPLGQGVANAVGFAMASKYAQRILGENVISHFVYCLCGDGDLEEGISYEACSLAGHHQLSNLILIYDSNKITIEGGTEIALSENIARRFEAQGFDVFECDGHNFDSIDLAIKSAKESCKPALIIAHTVIGKNAVGVEGSHKTHGAPLGAEVVAASKEFMGFEKDQAFVIAQEVKSAFEASIAKGMSECEKWKKSLSQEVQSKIAELQNPDFSQVQYPAFKQGDKVATRVSNGEILNAIARSYSGLVGGSADLGPSNNTLLKNEGDFPKGRNLHFGVREHAMGAICNGIANYGLFLPYCATFFVFSDYMAPSVRVASIMKTQVMYVWTHDSIGVGEDGATHQPIEQLSHFRAMPNLLVFRPADANENIACMQVALEMKAPSAFVLSRQNLEVLSPVSKDQVQKGAYVILESENPDVILLATGSEVNLALKGAEMLKNQGKSVRVVSMPCMELFSQQDQAYQDSILSNRNKTIAIEASRGMEWYRYAKVVIGMDSFGASGKGDDLFVFFKISVEEIVKKAQEI